MELEAWRTALVREIERAAEWRAEKAVADPEDTRLADSQQALFNLAEQVKALPPDHAELSALHKEETELGELQRATAGEPEARYHDAKEDLLGAYGIDHPPFDTVEGFLKVLRNRVDETISEYRLRACA
ncbi:MAG: hypothetical protein EA406_07235 [Rhodospirillales bacterium]|nr:MAG: hypothetical protein EA406_07235 [Rhodospirillales bacterium]